jgi:hypothetical protein
MKEMLEKGERFTVELLIRTLGGNHLKAPSHDHWRPSIERAAQQCDVAAQPVISQPRSHLVKTLAY